MEPWMAIPAVLAIHFGLKWLGKTDTTVGRRLRASDLDAWQHAVESKQRELDDLYAAKPGVLVKETRE